MEGGKRRVNTGLPWWVSFRHLTTGGMTRSARGIADNRGTNMKARSGLNLEIPETGRHSMMKMSGCKCMELIGVNPEYTSQSCNNCGFTDPVNRNNRNFECVACGHADHAGLNATRNIPASGTGAPARRGT